MEREKVISAYECVITRGKSVCECGKCDYHIKDSAVFFCDNQRVLTDALTMLKESVPQGVADQIRWERDTALSQLEEIGKGLGEKMDDIVAMMKEQEAVEPTLIREGRNKHYNDYVCPRCDNEVVYEQNYCSECGVQFLWEGR